jgi:hypothetical protein
MRWHENAIAWWGREAGFTGTTLALAVSLALATSEGDDAFWRVSSIGRTSDRRGLWGIETLPFGQPEGLDLWDPADNARAAWALYQAARNTFDWSPEFRAGTHDTYLLAGRDGADRPDPTQRARVDSGFGRVALGMMRGAAEIRGPQVAAERAATQLSRFVFEKRGI